MTAAQTNKLMYQFESITELPKKPSKFPAWVGPFSQTWLPLIGLIILALAIVSNNYDWIDSDAGLIVLAVGLGVTMLGIFCNWWSLGSDGREVKEWVKEDGTYDAESPRVYTLLADTWFHRLGYKRNKNAIRQFSVADKKIYVETKSGDVFTAPIVETDVVYTVMKGNTEESSTIKYHLTSGEQTISFYSLIGMLEREEWEDVFNLLLRAKSFKESKSSKALGFVQKAISIVEDGTGGEYSITEGVGDITSKLNENALKFRILGSPDRIK